MTQATATAEIAPVATPAAAPAAQPTTREICLIPLDNKTYVNTLTTVLGALRNGLPDEEKRLVDAALANTAGLEMRHVAASALALEQRSFDRLASHSLGAKVTIADDYLLVEPFEHTRERVTAALKEAGFGEQMKEVSSFDVPTKEGVRTVGAEIENLRQQKQGEILTR
jgi:hypothetical protein